MQLEALGQHLLAGDIEASERVAHNLKGASAQIGGAVVRRVACEMEEAANAGDLELALSLLPDLETELQTLRQALENWRRTG